MKQLAERHYGIAAELTKSKNTLARSRSKAEREWETHKELIKTAHENGVSLDQIAQLVDVSKSRVWQIITGRKR